MAGRMGVIAQRVTIIYFIFGDIQVTVKSLRDYADEWDNLPWKQFQVNLSRLQRRIHKAAITNDNTNVKRLQRLLLTSQSSRYLSVKNVVESQHNDDIFKPSYTNSINAKQKLEIVRYLNKIMGYKSDFDKQNISSNFKDILLLKKIQKKALQDLFYYSLLPVYEAYNLEKNEYSKMPTNMQYIKSQMDIHLGTQNPRQMKKILIFDIYECFDTFSIETFMQTLTLPASHIKTFNYIIKKDLSSFLYNKNNVKRHCSWNIVSPLFIKTLFFGVEKVGIQTFAQFGKSSLTIQDGSKILFIFDKQKCELNIKNKMTSLLIARGLQIEKIKLSVVDSTQGVDCLGWHLRVQRKNTKFIAYPTKHSRKKIVQTIKGIIRNAKYNLETRLEKASVTYKKWMRYYSTCNKLHNNKWQISKWLYKYIRNHTNYSRIDTIDEINHFVTFSR
jgi:RNA-directed DNA polymerase